MKLKLRPLTLVLTLLMTSCGGPKGPSQKGTLKKQSVEPVIKPKPEGEGQFLGILSPLNAFVAGKVTGAFTWSKEDDEIVGDVRFNGGATTADVIHEQNIQIGTRCPEAEDDLNNDGYIDAVEGEKVYGKALIPLDADLNNQIMGHGTFPVADNYGSYIYSMVASFEKLNRDILEEEFNPDDPFVKLGPEGKLSIEGKVVIIKGVSHTTILPNTVASNTVFANFQTFPVACGVIKKIITVPGSRQNDVSDLPVPSSGQPERTDDDDGAVIPIPPKDAPASDTTENTGSTDEASEDSSTEDYGYGEEEE